MATLDQPAAAAAMWADLERLSSHLHVRLQTLQRKPPDASSGDAVSIADRSVQALRSAIESDRSLRLGPPAPTAEQLGYSAAVIRERATELDQALDELVAAVTPK